MNYQITRAGQEESLAALNDKVAAVLEIFQSDTTSNAGTISQVTGLSHSEVNSIIRSLVRNRLIAPEETEQSFMGKMLGKMRR